MHGMILYDLTVSPRVLSQLDEYIKYIQCTLLNEQTAKKIEHGKEEEVFL